MKKFSLSLTYCVIILRTTFLCSGAKYMNPLQLLYGEGSKIWLSFMLRDKSKVLFHRKSAVVRLSTTKIRTSLTAVRARVQVCQKGTNGIILSNRKLENLHAGLKIKECPLGNDFFKQPFNHLTNFRHPCVPLSLG